MKIHTEVQGSPEWLALRSKFFTASEAPAMMGVSKYQSRTDLLALKKSGIAPDVDQATQRIFDQGHAAEASARAILEDMIGEDLFPVVASSGMLLASMDGMTMLEDVLFEHKLLNQGLVAQIKAGELEPHYYWQLEQQLLVSGAEKAIFVCSDGTAENFHQLEYRPVPGRAEQLLAGWAQFEADLAEFVPVEQPQEVVGKAPDELPALRIELTGMVTASNLKVFEESAMAVIGAVKTDLQTDQDFADAKKAVKWCGDVEAAVEAAKKQALSQTASIEELFKALDRVKAYARDTRLAVDKRVKSQEVSIKVAIKAKAEAAFTDHIATINKTLGRLVMPSVATDFAGAMKNKRTLASLRDAVDSELARAKIEANRIADAIRINLESLRTLAADHAFLFRDAQSLILKANDDFELLIKSRINEYEEEQAKAKKLEEERVANEEAAAALLAEKSKDSSPPASEVQVLPSAAVAPSPATGTAPVGVSSRGSVTRSAPAANAQPEPVTQAQVRRITIVIEGPTEDVALGMTAFGGWITAAYNYDCSDMINSSAA
ncbi:YqaJ viral recombinase family protein [Pseudomonas anguilliseptica]|uniref:Putative phage-type endonuclease n=1 Tax=Pseudomonas anguilliseptica TaxID=53406 RepID=A0A1H5F2Q0_PSEAG|nr:YqaJ viral recombinase family protein [Pseudomonas anguilliseptica]SED97686.1 putative phage-type endonuclease [Pseudomonas anguilliseptica]